MKNEGGSCIAAGAILGIVLSACSVSEGVPRWIFERLGPAPKDAGFRMEGYFVWGGSVI